MRGFFIFSNLDAGTPLRVLTGGISDVLRSEFYGVY